MNNFWNESVEHVMKTNGTNYSAVLSQREAAHMDGTCDGGSETDPDACPVCSAILIARYKAVIHSDVVRRNLRLTAKA